MYQGRQIMAAMGTLSYSGTAKITGGIFVGAGSSGMAQSFGEILHRSYICCI